VGSGFNHSFVMSAFGVLNIQFGRSCEAKMLLVTLILVMKLFREFVTAAQIIMIEFVLRVTKLYTLLRRGFLR
jgi:hypothetical protein